jgi:adenylosuccinate synthase
MEGNKLVIGLGFGDEGKGLVTNWLCLQNPNSNVVRFSGGHQVGHTVYKNGIKHIFSNFGSGTLQSCPTYWSKNCTIDPIGILNELYNLKINFPGIKIKLNINKKCPVVTPFDKIYNQYTTNYNEHGSTGTGFGATLEREENYYSLLFEDLYYPSILKEKLKNISEYYIEFKSYLIDIFKNFHKISVNASKEFLNNCNDIINLSEIEIVDDFYLWNNTSTCIFEGSQGLLLDKNIGFFPNVTRSNTGSKAACKEALNLNKKISEIFYVARAYQTRHGNGFMTNENINHNIKINPDESNIYNKYQGEFRRTLLDLDLLCYAMNKDFHYNNHSIKTSLIITCLDHIENEYKFTVKGKIIECKSEFEFISTVKEILCKSNRINNVYISKSPYSENIEKIF